MQREELAYGHMSFASRDPVFVELRPLAHTCPVGAAGKFSPSGGGSRSFPARSIQVPRATRGATRVIMGYEGFLV